MNNRLRTSKQDEIDRKSEPNGTNAGQNVTINDIADELGVSKTTISRALSGKGRIGAETRERVLACIEAHGYRPNLIAKSLAVSKTFNIAVTLPSDAEVSEIPFFQTCLQSITEALTAREYDVVLSITSGEDVSSLERQIRNQKIDGVILTRLLSDDKAITLLRGAKIPFAVIGSSADDSIMQVDTDHRAGCREVMDYVRSRGYRKVALLAGCRNHQVNKDRYAGFADSRGSGGDAVLWDMTDGDRVDGAMPSVMLARPDCLVCMDDVIAGRVLYWLEGNGYRVPDDVALVSFHDSALMAHHRPGITALHIHVHEMGALAGNILLDAISGKDAPRKNLVGYEFFVRGSSRAR